MFLVGGPAFSGTTLLSLMLNQGSTVCLDEPDFHNPAQSHRGIPFLQTLFPEKFFPERPDKPLSYSDAVRLIEACERAIHPIELGIKTCDRTFVDYGEIYKLYNYPIIAIFRDIRDVLVRPLPPWLDESRLNHAYRLIWRNLDMFDFWFRYEELVADAEPVLRRISALLNRPLRAIHCWGPEAVHEPMLKLDRHNLLKTGELSRDRVGIWKTANVSFSRETIETATMMGY
jgi:hypothetical protein